MRGFHNVCSHRGNTLVLDERGSCPGSVYCHFHNWIYSDTGALIRVPDEENFHDLDKRKHGLTPVNTDIWEGFIFVNLAPEPARNAARVSRRRCLASSTAAPSTRCG